MRQTANKYMGFALLLTIFLVMGGTAVLSMDRHMGVAPERSIPAGDAEQGRELIRQYGCSACHAVPNVAGPQGTTGPSLAHIAEQSYIAGVLTNTPQNLITWIQFPQEVDPQTAMPHVGVSYDDAVNIAAYLYSLDGDR